MTFELPLVFALIMCGAFLCLQLLLMVLREAQDAHYAFLERQKEQKDSAEVILGLEASLKELDEYKKRVDSLTLRAGFKI